MSVLRGPTSSCYHPRATSGAGVWGGVPGGATYPLHTLRPPRFRLSPSRGAGGGSIHPASSSPPAHLPASILPAP